jgi:hypothetical protein
MTRANQRSFVRHHFLEHEDELLRELVEDFGEDDWPAIAEELPGRSPRQCKERWNHYLSPHVVQGTWTVEEDELLLGLVEKNGTKWKTLEHYFVGRTDTNIKNRYNVLTRREAKRARKAGKLQANTGQQRTDDDAESRNWCELFTVEESELFWSSVFDC